MKLKEFLTKINELYWKYGDIDVCFDFKAGEPYLYTINKCGDDTNEIIDDYLERIFVEEIVDVQEIYSDTKMTKIDGICISNYKQEVEEDE